ncbi:MAG: hypothetical protein KGO81_14660 [Bacteroidota bacterium]|nr:hypothetical protein [Bacteroidota bacterium]
MKHSQTIGIVAVFLLIGVCFLPWIYIPSLQLTLDGFHGKVNNELTFGKQGLAHLFFAVPLVLFFLIHKIWAKRTNIFIGFLNLGWAIKNFILFNMCRMGECPQVKLGLYLMIILAILIQVMTFLPKMEIKQND